MWPVASRQLLQTLRRRRENNRTAYGRFLQDLQAIVALHDIYAVKHKKLQELNSSIAKRRWSNTTLRNNLRRKVRQSSQDAWTHAQRQQFSMPDVKTIRAATQERMASQAQSNARTLAAVQQAQALHELKKAENVAAKAKAKANLAALRRRLAAL